MRHILLVALVAGLTSIICDARQEDDFLYNKMATIEGTVVIINHPRLGRTPCNGTSLLFQRTDCKKCVVGTRTDLDGRYSIRVLQGRYRVILREGQIEGEGIDLLAPDQPRIVEARSPIEPAKFDIEVLLPKKK